jgi:hypothetical protein
LWVIPRLKELRIAGRMAVGVRRAGVKPVVS